MKKILICITTLFLLFFGNFTYANPDPKAIVEKTITELMQKYKIVGAAVELYVDGKPYAYHFGYEQNTKYNPVTDKTIFEIGSITKLFTNLLLAIQINAGKMQLDAPLANYLSDFQQQGHAIRHVTLENLATYTANLPFNLPQKITTRNEMIKFLTTWKPDTPIGTEWRYSNVSTGLIGDALEVLLHENYNEMYRNHILLPLKMDPIGITIPDRYKRDYAQGYNADDKPVPSVEYGLFPAAGSLKASARDMQLFLKAAIGLTDTPRNIQQAMQITQTPHVAFESSLQGLGWNIHPLNPQTRYTLLHEADKKIQRAIPAAQLPKSKQIFDGDKLIDKTGATYGFRAYIAVIPNKKSGIVILANKNIDNDGAIVNAGRSILLQLTEQS